MNQIIGGMFGLQVEQTAHCNAPLFLSKPHKLLSTARSGIAFLVKCLSPNRIWMPSYLCDVMLKAVADSDVQIYPIDIHLRIITDGWIDKLKTGDLVVFIDYFGFQADTQIVRLAKNRHAWVLEDASQALLSDTTKSEADFILYSPRKYLGVPDGGILVINNPEVSFIEWQLPNSPSEWWLSSLRASIRRREFDRFGGDRDWFDIFKQVDKNGPINPCLMSELSQLLIQYQFDYKDIAQRRIDNYKILLEKLGEFSLFTSLPHGIVPLGFPLRMRNRDQVLKHLFNNNIYPPVHWDIKQCIPDIFHDSYKLSKEIMTLVCDQRYDQDDMNKTASLFLEVAKGIQQ